VTEARKMWVDVDRCYGCGVCGAVCPEDAITIVRFKAQVEGKRCNGCGACLEVCTQGAIMSTAVVEPVAVPVPSPESDRSPSTVGQVAIARNPLPTGSDTHLLVSSSLPADGARPAVPATGSPAVDRPGRGGVGGSEQRRRGRRRRRAGHR
jgi:Pyruvate/2-oxoacid:ferredoxin oxidoreductase delta subunit